MLLLLVALLLLLLLGWPFSVQPNSETEKMFERDDEYFVSMK